MGTGRLLRMKIRGVLPVVLFVLLSGCIFPMGKPIIWQIEPNAAHVGDTITVTASGLYLLVYSSIFDFGGAIYEDQGYPYSSWEPVEGELRDFGFFEISFEVPEGATSGCVTLADGYHGAPGSTCYPFTVLEAEEDAGHN